MAKERPSNGVRVWIVRVSAAVAVAAVLALAAAVEKNRGAVQNNRERIITVEGHIPYIKAALERIEKKLDSWP